MNRGISQSLLRAFAFVLAVVLLLLNVLPTNATATNNAAAGEQGYVSLHQYVSRTDIENVYRVEASIQAAPLDTPPVYVTFVLDSTGSMTKFRNNDAPFMDFYTDSPAMAGTRPKYGTSHVERAVGAVYAMHEALDVLKASQNPEKIYVNVLSYNSMSLTGLMNGGDGGTVNAGNWNAGSNFVPLLDPTNPSRINPVIADTNPLADIAQIANLYDHTKPYIPPAIYDWLDPVGTSGGAITANIGNVKSAVAAYLSIMEAERLFSIPPHSTGLASSFAPIYGYRLQQNGKPMPPTATHQTAGNYIAPGLAGAYRDLRTLKATTTDYNNASKYVLLLADGNDTYFATSQGWALALKAPVGSPAVDIPDDTVAYPARSTVNKVLPSSGSSYETLGATLWSVGFGRFTPHHVDWNNKFFSNTTTPGDPWTSVGYGAGFGYWSTVNDGSDYTEPHLIALAAEANSSTQWNNLITAYNALTGFTLSTTPVANMGNLDKVLQVYQNVFGSSIDSEYHFVTHLSQTKQNLTTVPGADFTTYTPVPGFLSPTYDSVLTNAPPSFSDEEEAQQVFGSFAQATLPDITDVMASTKMNTAAFNLYQYSGKPLLDASMGTAKSSGGNIIWDIGVLPHGSYATLVYYIQLLDDVNPDLFYDIGDSVFTYKRPDFANPGVMLDAVKNFPVVYIKKGGEIQGDTDDGNSVGISGGDGSTENGASDGSDSGGIFPLFVVPYDESKYTASVDTRNIGVEDEEKLQEKEEPVIANENVADAAKESIIPNTGTIPPTARYLFIGMLVFFAAVTIVVAIKRRI